MRPFLVLVILVSLTLSLSGQQYFFRQYSGSEGLSAPFVYDITQDNLGFIWLGTPDGLYRFNGIEFELFTIEKGISENFVTKIFKDSKGRIWLGHSNGSVSLQLKKGFKIFNEQSELRGSVTDIGEDDQGSIWILIQNQGLILINRDHTVTPVKFPDKNEQLSQIEFIGDERFIIGSQESLFIVQYNRSESSFEIIQKVEAFPMAHVVDILPDADEGYVIVSRNDGIYLLNPEAKEEAQFFFCHDENPKGILDNLYGSIIDRNGDLWLNSMGNGLIRLRKNDQKAYTIVFSLNGSNGLVSENIRSAFEDLEGNLWFGTFGEGLLRLVDNNLKFPVPVSDIEQSPETYALTGFDKNFLIISGNSLLSLSQPGDTVLYSMPLPVNQTGERVNAVHISNDSTIWLGFENAGLYKAESMGSQFYALKISEDELANSVNHIASQGDFVWIATKNGLCRLTRSTGKLRWFTTNEGLPHNNIRQVYIDNSERVFIATNCKEIHYIDGKGVVVVLNRSAMGSFNSIVSFAEDKQGALWAGSQGNGVWKFSKDTILNFMQKGGLQSDFCYSLAITEEGNPIVGHTGGISVIEQATNNIKTFGPGEGVESSTEFYSNAVLVDQVGDVWFGTSEGLIKYTSVNLMGDMMPPLIQLVSVQVDGESLDFSSGTILLDPGNYEISVEYIGLNFKNPEGVRYQTFFEGYNRTWSDLNGNRNVKFDKVGHGDYSLHIKAINENKVESELVSACEILIKNPFYLTIWFYALLAILLGASFYSILKRRERNQRLLQISLEKELMKRTGELVKEKNKIERLNKDITESINYAKEIQRRTLSPIEEIKNAFSGAFVLFQPRDIVSGDFYWFQEFKNGKSVLICADSTGHGVPGAFISIIGISKIKEICGDGNIESPSVIMKLLDEEIKSILTQTVGVEDLPDGMDCVIAVFDVNAKKATFSSAMNPLIFYKGNEQIYLKGDKFSVGGRDYGETKIFRDQVFEFDKGDKCYLFSDGIVDQFGGPDGKKLKMSGFKTILNDIHQEPMDIQHEYIKNRLSIWKGDLDQIDDILLMGFEF